MKTDVLQPFLTKEAIVHHPRFMRLLDFQPELEGLSDIEADASKSTSPEPRSCA